MTSVLPPHIFKALSNVERKQYILKLRLIKHLYIKGPSSVLDICTDLVVSSPTLTSILNDLLSEGQIEKYGQGTSIGGRKPDLFRLKDHTLYVLSIHMEKFKMKMVILDNNNNYISDLVTVPVEISKDLSAIDQLYQHAQTLIDKSGIVKDKLLGIGISMPGLVSATEGENYTYLLTPQQSESIVSLLERKFNKPVYIQNDAKAIALAERYFGQANDKKDVLILSIDWGIGLGVIMDYKLRSGISGFAGEFGHIPMIDDGLLCHCGKRGCLETVASGLALTRMAIDGLKTGHHSILNKLPHKKVDAIEIEDIVEAANQGDQFAIKMLSKAGINLGKGLSILIQLFNPQMIILGGKIAAANQYITTPIQQSINTYCMAQLSEKTTIGLSALGENAGIMGAVATIMENLFLDQIALETPKRRDK